ncbi:hypothetical protein Q8F55_007171 [Vanrija albida]|uniref:Major facilitator superfamily (MFS) profile domain-containing protein n=1 Tax=Vanrija albida TaxID=181172 RepID=A0ABR3PZX4_9TREE
MTSEKAARDTDSMDGRTLASSAEAEREDKATPLPQLERTRTQEDFPQDTVMTTGNPAPQRVFSRISQMTHRTDVEVKEPDGTVVTFPDGGWRAWLVVIGGMHTLFATFGFVNAWGIFQQYYEANMFPDKSTSQIAWIGSLQYLLIYLPAVYIGRLVDLSQFYWPFWIASVMYAVSIFLTAQVKEYWQAMLTHGVLFGLSAGVLFCPGIAVVQHWFFERRALALGAVACASSMGGTVFPIMVSRLLERVGFQWTMRISAFVLLYCCTVASLCLRTRLPPKAAPGGIFNVAAFKSAPYALFTLGSFFMMAGLYTPLSFFDLMGRQQGLGSYSTYLIAIANAFSLVGRAGPALIADRTGSVNILIPGLLGSAATTFAWPYCTTKVTLTVIAALNGIFQGCFVSLLAPGVASLGSVEDLGRRFGMVNTIMSFGSLLGAPVSGAILAKYDFHAVSYYAGSMILAGFICFLLSRQINLKGKLWGKM